MGKRSPYRYLSCYTKSSRDKEIKTSEERNRLPTQGLPFSNPQAVSVHYRQKKNQSMKNRAEKR